MYLSEARKFLFVVAFLRALQPLGHRARRNLQSVERFKPGRGPKLRIPMMVMGDSERIVMGVSDTE